MIPRKLPSQKYLKECFEYSPYLGTLYWKDRPAKHFKNEQDCAKSNGRFSGRLAGRINKGYNSVGIKGHQYFAHRIIWKIMTGKDPIEQIDHKDNNTLNNKWNNLREATQSQNNQNKYVLTTNSLGLKGVYSKREKYCARISKLGVTHHLGTFNTSEEAHAAYKEAHAAYKKAARNLHKEFANSG